MMLQTPVQPPVRGVPSAVLLARRAKKGGAGLGGYDPYTGSWVEDASSATTAYSGYATVQPYFEVPVANMPAGVYSVGGQPVQFAGGSSDALARALAPVIAGTMNLITAMYSPPAYKTVTGPGGSTTEIRVPGTVTGQPPQVAAGFSSTTIMVVVAAVVVMMMMNRR